MFRTWIAESWGTMRHNELDREFSRDGEMTETQQPTEALAISFSVKCQTSSVTRWILIGWWRFIQACGGR
jgi:hypothetical protein